MGSDSELQEPLIERLSSSPEPEPVSDSSKKRKRADVPAAGTKLAKKSKKSKASQAEDLDIESGVNKSFAKMDSQLLSDYVAQRTTKFESDLSSVELEDKYISGEHPYLELGIFATTTPDIC
jgi:protein CMS1